MVFDKVVSRWCWFWVVLYEGVIVMGWFCVSLHNLFMIVVGFRGTSSHVTLQISCWVSYMMLCMRLSASHSNNA